MNVASKKNICLIFGGFAAIFVFFAIVLLNHGEKVKWHATEIETNWLPSIISINTIRTAINNYRIVEVNYISTNEGHLKAESNQRMVLLNKEVQGMKAKYEQTMRPHSEKERVIYQHFAKSYEDYLVVSKQVITFSESNESAKAMSHLIDNESLFNTLVDYLKQLADLSERGGIHEGQLLDNNIDGVKLQVIVGVVIVTVALIIIGFLLSNAQTKNQERQAIIKIRRNIFLIFLSLTVIALLFGGLLYQNLSNVNEQSNQVSNKWLPSLVNLSEISVKTSGYKLNQTFAISSTQVGEKNQLDKASKVLVEDIGKLRKKFLSIISSDIERDMYSQFSASYDEYVLLSKKIEELSRTNEINKVLPEYRDSEVLYDDFSVLLVDLIGLDERETISLDYKIDAGLVTLNVINIGGVSFIVILLMVSLNLVQGWLFDEAFDEQVEGDSDTGLTIKLKLQFAFIGIFCVFILFSMLVNSVFHVLNNNNDEIELDWLPSIIKVNQINKITKIRASYELLISSEVEGNIYQDFSIYYSDYIKKSELMLALSAKNDRVAALSALQINRIEFDAMVINLEKLVHLNAEGGTDATQLSEQVFKESQQIIYAAILSILLLTIFILIIFDKNISVPMHRLTNSVRSLAAGVLESSNSDLKDRHDEIGQMTRAVEMVKQTLQALTIDANELIHAAEDSLDSSFSGMSVLRIDADHHPGEFKKIVSGMNNLIDVMSKPLRDIAEIMQNLALGDLSGRMEGDYAGELYTLKSNVNRSLEALVSLLTELSQTMQHMASNDLTHHLMGNYQGEFSLLKASTNQTIGHMIEILQEITIGTTQSAVAIAQTSEASKYVADEASQQMFAIENVSKTIEDTANSVSAIAQKAHEGSQLANSTASFVSDGQIQLNKLIDLIQNVDAEYVRIEKITDEITRIADKTHLLSLNAGLEAMRAGEYGVGFGFVAQQIGTLSEEVTASANSIGSVINSSGQKLRLGVHAMQETQAVMVQIAQAARASEVNVESILVSIVQQSEAVKTITERVQELSVSSGATASAAEEISSTMIHLAETVKETANKVKRFKLAEN